MAPVTRRKRLSEQAELEANTPEVTPSKSTEKLPLRGKGSKASKVSDETQAAEPSSATPTKTAKNNKTVFNDDDDNVSAPVVTKKPAPAPAEPEQDSEDSDDEAPEAVSTVKAATEVKETAKASKKAAQEYVLLYCSITSEALHVPRLTTTSLGKPRHKSESVRNVTRYSSSRQRNAKRQMHWLLQ